MQPAGHLQSISSSSLMANNCNNNNNDADNFVPSARSTVVLGWYLPVRGCSGTASMKDHHCAPESWCPQANALCSSRRWSLATFQLVNFRRRRECSNRIFFIRHTGPIISSWRLLFPMVCLLCLHFSLLRYQAKAAQSPSAGPTLEI